MYRSPASWPGTAKSTRSKNVNFRYLTMLLEGPENQLLWSKPWNRGANYISCPTSAHGPVQWIWGRSCGDQWCCWGNSRLHPQQQNTPLAWQRPLKSSLLHKCQSCILVATTQRTLPSITEYPFSMAKTTEVNFTNVNQFGWTMYSGGNNRTVNHVVKWNHPRQIRQNNELLSGVDT